MPKLTLTIGIATAAALVAGSALAAECTGVGARKYAAPVILHKAEDGTVTMLSTSTGTSTITSPPARSSGASWQECSGLITVKPDQSRSGAGNCYTVDSDGDWWIASWDLTGFAGNWSILNGTGKYAGQTGGGTWKSGYHYADGTGQTLWEGTCPN